MGTRKSRGDLLANMSAHSANHGKRQQGSSVVLVLLFLMALSAAGMGMMYASNIDTLVDTNYRQSLSAYYASKAGLEEGRDRLRGGVSPIARPTIMPTTANATGVVYIVNPDNNGAVSPWTAGTNYFDDELCHEQFPSLGLTSVASNIPCQGAVAGTYYTSYNSIDPNSGTASAIPYKWVRITLKQAQTTNPWCTDGVANCANASPADANATKQVCADGNGNEILLPAGAGNCQAVNYQPVYTITSMARTSTGARRITQQEVADITVPPLPGALVLDGNGATVSTPNSNNYFINGNNANSCNANPPAANLPAVGTTSNTDQTNVANSFPNNRIGNYTGADGTTPDVANVSGKLGAYSTVGGLEMIVNDLTSVADQVVPPNGSAPTPPWGTQANPLITVIQGDYSGSCNGFGILLITGALTCNGNYNWTGVILVIGKGYVQALNGGGGGQVTGAILVANTYDHLCSAGDNSCNSQHLLSPTSAPGQPYFNWNGGGRNGLQYDNCEISIVNNHIGFHILVTREEMY